MRRWLSLLGFCVALGATAAPPQRIVSANLCADRLVLALADPENVVSVSYFAADPLISTVTGLVGDRPLNHADAEEIAAFHPDLVIFGRYTQKAAAEMVRSLGIPVYYLPHPATLAALRSAIREVAERLGVPERGERMVAKIDRLLAEIDRPHPPVRAIFYTDGGWTPGSGTMADDLLKRFGAVNIADEAGITGMGMLPLEKLVAAKPQLVVLESAGPSQASLQNQLLQHPALSGNGIRRLDLPTRLWACADESVVEAAKLIDKALP